MFTITIVVLVIGFLFYLRQKQINRNTRKTQVLNDFYRQFNVEMIRENEKRGEGVRKMYYRFPGEDESVPEMEIVGGKGFSLMKLTVNGFPVPPGIVIPSHCFAEMIEELKGTELWKEFVRSEVDDVEEVLEKIKVHCTEVFGKEIEGLLEGMPLREHFGEGEKLFAVRSSSPEEDLEGASFAGGYETILGVHAHGLAEAVTVAFVSCLDARVISYKNFYGMDIYNPSIAVVIQEQISCDVAGVAFSINPMTNCFDDITINSNWGVGESVVSGEVSPDCFWYDKVSLAIKEKQLGKKETSIWIDPNGGTKTTQHASEEFSLSDDQIHELSAIVLKIEELYGMPMDIEFGFKEGILFILQARPIAMFFPLSEDLMTIPGEPKRLSIDVIGLSQGMFLPLSPMTMSCLQTVIAQITGTVGISPEIVDEMLSFSNSRVVLRVSNFFGMKNIEDIGSFISKMDTTAALILQEVINSDEYQSKPKLFFIWQMIQSITATKWMFKGFIRYKKAINNPNLMIEYYKTLVDKLDEIVESLDEDIPDVWFSTVLRKFVEYAYFFPVCLRTAMTSYNQIGELIQGLEGVDEYYENLDKTLPNNVTLVMLSMISDMASKFDKERVKRMSFEEFQEDSVSNHEFQLLWFKFLDDFGMRGEVEIEIATPRFDEEPNFILNQVYFTAQSDGPGFNEMNAKNVEKQKNAVEQLHQIILRERGEEDAQKFLKLMDFVMIKGFRETHKYCLIKIFGHFRKKLLKIADEFVAQDLLEDRNDIFDFNIDDISRAMRYNNIDLRALKEYRNSNLVTIQKFKSLPVVFDSRGTIYKPPRPQIDDSDPNIVVGYPISPGIVTGRVKVLSSPNEKPILPGDILVTQATNPGWTPLFINASAILLQMGGILQHGALVAREYGKPCIVGIDNIMEVFKDDQLIELDGSTGIIRILSD